MQEFAETAGLTNFGKEADHAQMKCMLRSSSGRAPCFQTAAVQHSGASVSFDHDRFVAPPPKLAAVGRPKEQMKKRKRFDAWNVYVAAHPPVCEKCQAGATIKSGEQMKYRAATWGVIIMFG